MNLNIKTSKSIKLLSACLMLLILTNCKKESKENNSIPIITLSADKETGEGQYSANYEFSPNSAALAVNASIAQASELQSFTITKTLNLTNDPTFGQAGVLTVDPAAIASGQYTFSYSPKVEDVNQLVGFKFTATNKRGAKYESDLTLKVTFSPAGNLPYKKWQLKSILHVNGDPANEEIIEACNLDDFMVLNTDGTYFMEYGNVCFLEAIEGWRNWTLSADNKTFTLEKFNVLDAAPNYTTSTYVVKELTLTTFNIELTVDMTAFNGAVDEKFLYKYVAVAK